MKSHYLHCRDGAVRHLNNPFVFGRMLPSISKKEIMNLDTGLWFLWLKSTRTIQLVLESGRILSSLQDNVSSFALTTKPVEEKFVLPGFYLCQQKLKVSIYLLPVWVLFTEGQTSLLGVLYLIVTFFLVTFPINFQKTWFSPANEQINIQTNKKNPTTL